MTHVALTKCFYCGGAGVILLATRFRRLTDGSMSAVGGKALEAAHGKVADMTPCADCADLMKRGVILLTIDPERSDPAWALKHRWMFIEHAAAERLGLVT